MFYVRGPFEHRTKAEIIVGVFCKTSSLGRRDLSYVNILVLAAEVRLVRMSSKLTLSSLDIEILYSIFTKWLSNPGLASNQAGKFCVFQLLQGRNDLDGAATATNDPNSFAFKRLSSRFVRIAEICMRYDVLTSRPRLLNA